MASRRSKAASRALNRACAENESDTPDFVLTEFLLDALNAVQVPRTIGRKK